MSEVVDSEDVARFRSFVERTFGFALEHAKVPTLAEILGKHAAPSGLSARAYLARLETLGGTEDLRALAVALTIPETYFFRGRDQLNAFREVALPARARARDASRRLRILSAGCASGEEPYSLAILVHEARLDPSFHVSIVGADVNTAMLAKARTGLYTAWSLRDTPPAVRARWFVDEDGLFRIHESIRRAVTFEERNLTNPDDPPWPEASFDIVFWRNVMMYFTPAHADAVLARLTRALAPGGYLFLGHAETLRGTSTELRLRHTHDTFYYQRKELNGGSVPPPPQVSLAAPAPPELPQPRPDAAPGADEVEHALTLFARERFAEALALVADLPEDVRKGTTVAVLHAALLLQSGAAEEARRLCEALLEVDELDPGAHYLAGVAREAAGEREAAADHHRIAAYLDPTFAMPRLHLGLLARRAGDRSAARRELTQALSLLHGEHPRRLLLFGGGFGAEALATLCCHELAACGDAT
ncbi:MAG: Protein-glutamate O-methyltransferase [Labilithrix sp.]|nr:Protein-glutamate O-methyltransferase [Labilithrix sp.]